jgi:predicted DNA-binding protein (MmcQ/YjbR family)
MRREAPTGDEVSLAAFAAGLPGAWADSPWGEDHLVYKVGPAEQGKIFVFIGEEGVGVKAGASREIADEWLQRYPDDASVMAYIGRSGWNDLRAGRAIPDDELREAILDSYTLVVSKLPKKHRPDGWDLPPSVV